MLTKINTAQCILIWMLGSHFNLTGTHVCRFSKVPFTFHFNIIYDLSLIANDYILSVLHIVPYSTFRKNWRAVYVGLMVLSGVVTPDASPVTMILMYAALLALYEISLAVARMVITARDGKEALRWTREDYEKHALDEI